MGRATGYNGRYESARGAIATAACDASEPLRFSKCGSIIFVSLKAKRVEPVPGSKGIKKAPASFPRGLNRLLKSREASPDAPTLSQSTDHTRATKSLSKKCRSLSKKLQVKHPSALNMTSPTGDYRRKESGHEKARSMPWKAGLGCPLP